MEAIVGLPMRPPVNLRKFLDDYNAVLKAPYNLPVTDVNIQEAMKLTEDTERYQVAEENCALDLLQSFDDHRVTEFIPGFTELPRTSKMPPNNTVKLETISALLKFKDNTQRNPFKRSTDIYTMLKLPELVEKGGGKESLDYKPGQELKIYVRVYRPARATHENRTLEKPVLAQEFECLGSNYLTDLRDKIQCVCSNKRFFDISETPEAPLLSKETDPGYFFITDTFYNDKRNPLNADYSAHIRNWAKTAKGLEAIKFKSALMEETRFIDLTVSLGFPQHYQHHGNCEHVFVFSQLEIIATPQTQVFPRPFYPRLKAFNHFNNRLCNTCGSLHYVYVVKGSNRQVYDPAYLCKRCFLSYHYIDGKKIGDFQAYRLLDCNEQQESEEAEKDAATGDECHTDVDSIADDVSLIELDNEIDELLKDDMIIKEEETIN